ncbi:hypothetical protein BGX34_009360 [Mortierella sp. NVP85]|nr:hypothetical protein BGX34_009360 [Mortierella sp. NVP85]
MSGTHSQAFCTQSSSKIISIPTRHDPKTAQRVVRWKDILQCFENAKYVMNGGETVLFLTDDDLEDLLPLRIPHHPGVVLEVVMPDTSQDDSLSMVPRPVESERGQMQVLASRNTPESMERGVIATRVNGSVNSQALVRLSRDPSEMALQGMHTSGTGHSQLRSESNMSQQEQLHQLQQQIQQLQQQLEQIQYNPQLQQQMEQTQQTQEQIRDQMDEIQRSFEKMGEETRHSQHQTHTQQQIQQQIDQALHPFQQKHEQLLQELQEVKQTVQEQDHLTPDQRRQETREALDQFTLVQYRIQDILNRSYQRSPAPRLFILLPEPAVAIDGHETPSPHFRLYFLCECGAHTMAKDYNKPHEIHVAEYRGYKLVKQDEFIRKYGRYILTIMYMVKYGAKSEGLVVPPVLGLHHAIVPDDDQEHLGFLKKNISRLIDDTITYLEKVSGAIGSDTNTVVHQRMSSKQLGRVERYLKIEGEEEEDEQDRRILIDGLSRAMTQDGRHVWVCSRHKRWYHEATLQRLRDTVTANGGKYRRTGNNVSIGTIPSALVKQVYAELVKVCRIRKARNQQSLAILDLRSSIGVVVDLSEVESLCLDMGRLLMKAITNHRGFKDVAITMRSLKHIKQEDLDLILQCRPTQLTILDMSERAYWSPLVRILWYNPWTVEYRLGCQTELTLVAIDVVISASLKRPFQGRVFPEPPRVLKLMNERTATTETPEEIVTTIHFNGKSNEFNGFNLETHLVLDRYHLEDPYFRSLIRRYGWSIKKLTLANLFDNRHAKLLDEITPRCPSIEFLDCHSASLASPGLDALERILKRSTSPISVRLKLSDLHVDRRQKSAVLFLKYFKSRLKGLHLRGAEEEGWLPKLARTFPNRCDFPVLEDFYVGRQELYYYGIQKLSSLASRWIRTMVSVPPQPLARLKSFGFSGFSLVPKDMSDLISVIDFTALVELRLGDEVTQEQLELLVDRIVIGDTPSLPLRLLQVECGFEDYERAGRKKIRKKLPQVKILGLDDIEVE